MIVRGGVARRREQGLWIWLGRGWRGVVVLVLACRGLATVAQSLTLSQLAAQCRHPFFLLQSQGEGSKILLELPGLLNNVRLIAPFTSIYL